MTKRRDTFNTTLYIKQQHTVFLPKTARLLSFLSGIVLFHQPVKFTMPHICTFLTFPHTFTHTQNTVQVFFFSNFIFCRRIEKLEGKKQGIFLSREREIRSKTMLSIMKFFPPVETLSENQRLFISLFLLQGINKQTITFNNNFKRV